MLLGIVGTLCLFPDDSLVLFPPPQIRQYKQFAPISIGCATGHNSFTIPCVKVHQLSHIHRERERDCGVLRRI